MAKLSVKVSTPAQVNPMLKFLRSKLPEAEQRVQHFT
jgi:hypothetical protein